MKKRTRYRSVHRKRFDTEIVFSPYQMSPPVTIPVNIDPVDWLISQSPEYSQTAIARWPYRHRCDLLVKLAQFHARFPDYNGVSNINGLGLVDYVLFGSGYAYSAHCTNMRLDQIKDRRASMLGGFPWTCSKYPWPFAKGIHPSKKKLAAEERQPGPLSPLIQLNLSELQLAHVGEFPKVIVQIWGDHIEPLLRVIPLSSITGEIPDAEYYKHAQEHLSFENAEPGIAGQFLKVGGDAWFEIPGDAFNDIPRTGSPENGADGDCPLFKYFTPQDRDDFEELYGELIDLWHGYNSKISPVSGHKFGGVPSPIQGFYQPSTFGGNLFEAHTYQGLWILGDGNLQIEFSGYGDDTVFSVTCSR